jgi:NOL1/NOP2/sun family putative RNA methylase
MIPLPPDYLEQMKQLLQDTFPTFLKTYEQPATKSLRVNRLKLSPSQFMELSPFQLQGVPWCAEGYYYHPEQDRPGKHVYHAAGLYYIQDASAMAAVEALEPQPGERVLDLCAAPGGKTTQIAAKMNNQGLLVANEVDGKRCSALIENLERCGVTHAVVLQATPEKIAQQLPQYFDRILIDAPCSGEGMFRKDREARERWSLRLVEKCQSLQKTILTSAAAMLRPGGRLVYSTCTFNPQENEAVIEHFLQQQPGFHLIMVNHATMYQPGQRQWVAGANAPLQKTARLWPHALHGEGHFIAVLEKRAADEQMGTPRLAKPPRLAPQAQQHFKRFIQETLISIDMDSKSLLQVEDQLYRLPTGCPSFGSLRIRRLGQYLGRVKRSHFQPAHAWALSLHPSQAQRIIDLPVDSSELQAYLRGETLPTEAEDGWALLTVNQFPLGWGKVVQKHCKNHYPKRLRWKHF